MMTASSFYRNLAEFISDPTPQAFNHLAHLLGILTVTMPIQHDTADLVHVRSARRAMASILDRRERIGMLVVTHLDALTLRASTPHIEAAIGRTRFEAFSFANALVSQKMEQDGVTLSD